MEEIAAETWRPEYGQAWCKAFAIVGAMIEGAESVAVEVAA
jgi:hypothetical protein